MKLTRQLSLITFLSIIVCAVTMAVDTYTHNSLYKEDIYGWPHPFLKLVFDEGKIVDKHLDMALLGADYLYSFIATLLFFIFIDMMTIRKKSMLAADKTEEAQRLKKAHPTVRRFLAQANQ